MLQSAKPAALVAMMVSSLAFSGCSKPEEPSEPPPDPSLTPHLSLEYGKARAELLSAGYRAAHASAKPFMGCSKALAGDAAADCKDTPLPEVGSCSQEGQAFCDAYWLAPDGQRVLRVITYGRPQPGKLYYKSWATAEELRELPPNWRP